MARQANAVMKKQVLWRYPSDTPSNRPGAARKIKENKKEQSMNPMYITFGIYLVAVLLIGLAAYFSTRNFDDYILGGRSLGPFAVFQVAFIAN